MYTILHCHDTWGSLGDSTLHVSDYIKQVKKLGMNAAAITNHGSLSSVFSFYQCCVQHQIKPIIGYEAYIVDDVSKTSSKEKRHHVILLAKNKEGFNDLMRLHNEAALSFFYYKPRIDLSLLKRYGHNLIGLSACVYGEIPSMILDSSFSESDIIHKINEYKDCLNQQFYLELQPGSFETQRYVNQQLIKLSAKTNTPLVITNDIHYLRKEDAAVHDAHIKIIRHQLDKEEMIYPDTCYYIMDEQELRNSFHNTIDNEILDNAIKNTNYIADMIESYPIKEETIYMPHNPLLTDEESETKLEMLCCERFKELFESGIIPKDKADTYLNRLQYELDTIRSLEFTGYFLVVANYVQFCKNHQIIVGPGRGSACGSLAAYLLGITSVDPVKYNLLFERFLSKYRTQSIPDIDIDVPPDKRPIILSYLQERYGKYNVAEVSTPGMRKIKKAIRDSGRLLGMSQEQINHMSGKASDKFDTEEEKQSFEEFFKAMNSEWFHLTQQLIGYPVSKGIHAAGVIISPVSLIDKTPLRLHPDDGHLIADLTLEDVESAGFVKMDLLPLKTLSVCEKIKTIQPDISFSYDNESCLHDQKIWDVIGSSETFGLFQISGAIYKKRMAALHPSSIEELANVLALLRGPCISQGLDDTYQKRLNKIEAVYPIHDIYDSVTKNTYGILLYQEQIMELSVAVGFTHEDSYRLMKAISKKKIDDIQQFSKRFKQYAEEKHISSLTANQLWDLILNAGKYCFNRSHAIAYALLCYFTAYLRVYFPLAFCAAILTNESEKDKGDKKPIESFIKRQKLGDILPVHINKSLWEYTIENGHIRRGFCDIASVGQKAYKEIERVRNNLPISSYEDFCCRSELKTCNKTVRKALLRSGCFADMTKDKLTQMDNMDKNKIIKINQHVIRKLQQYVQTKGGVSV